MSELRRRALSRGFRRTGLGFCLLPIAACATSTPGARPTAEVWAPVVQLLPSPQYGAPDWWYGWNIAGGGSGPFASLVSEVGAFWNPDSVIDDWVPIPVPPGVEILRPYDTNDKGWIVGTADSQPYRGFLYKTGIVFGSPTWILEDLPNESIPYAVNNAGVIVGTVDTAWPKTPRLWKPFRRMADGTFEWLALPTGAVGGRAYDINEAGVIVGFVRVLDERRAYRWQPNGTGAYLSAPAGPSEALAINNDGVIVGYASNTAARWSAGGAIESLGVTGRATDINDSGVVVGSGLQLSPVDPWAFVLVSGQPYWLPRPSGSWNPWYDYVRRVRIDGCGRIMGWGELTPQGSQTVFRWNPIGSACN